MTVTTRLIRSIAEIRAGDLALAGGKGVGLGELSTTGLTVPDGFVVTTAAYRLAMRAIDGQPTPEGIQARQLPDPVREAVLEAYGALGGGPVAVRSSATAEDLPGASFAGQQDTVLGVLGEEDLLTAVRTCWASLWGERAVAYRERLGSIDPDEVGMAVVVQQMVDADVAGVMFTANPVTGARDQVVIDSSPGLGEAVVSGRVTPDHAVLDAQGHVFTRTAGRADVVIVRDEEGGTITRSSTGAAGASEVRLDEPTLAALADAGRRVAQHFGMPMDLEWAVQGGRIAMLQARPMTALPPPPRHVNRLQRLTGPVIRELFPRRPTPLELTAYLRPVVVPLVEGMLGGVIGVRLDFEEVMRVQDGIMTEFIPPLPHPTPAIPRRLLRSLSQIGRDPARWVDDPRATQHAAACAALAAQDPAGLGWAELLGVPARVAAITELVTDLRVDFLPASGAAPAALTLLLATIGQHGRQAGLLADVATHTTQANAALATIADQIQSDQELADLVRTGTTAQAWLHLSTHPRASQVHQELTEFLVTYGHRETSSILLVRDPTWADSPQTVVGILRALLERPAPADAAADHDPLAALLGTPVVQQLRIGPLLTRLVQRARAGIAFREDTHFEITRPMSAVRSTLLEIGHRLASAGLLADADDVWFLTWAEVCATADPAGVAPLDPVGGGATDPDRALATRAARRRARYEELVGAPLASPLTLYPDADDGPVDGALVSGTGGGGGQATGRVRVIPGPDSFGELHAGEVLVCAETNPSWTPLFSTAAAVVVDHGGFASHAAIVARECGIPAVMGCGDGTSVLKTGQLVVVDGDRGVVLPGPEQVGTDG